MKIRIQLFILCLIGIPLALFSQTMSNEEGIEYYNAIVSDPNSSDTAVAHSYLELSSLLYVSNIDTMIPLCNRVIEIVGPKLAQAPAEKERMVLLNLYSGALNNIAVVYMTNGEIERCLDYLEQSLEICQKTGDNYQIATALNNIGYILNDQGNITKALDYYHQSLEISKKIDDKIGIATLLNNIAAIYKEQNNLTEALDYYQRSLPMLQSERQQQEISGVYNSIGSVIERQGNKKLAMQYYLKSLEIARGIKDKKGVANCYSSLAGLYLSNNEIDSAFIYHDKSLALRRTIGFKDGIAISTIKMAEIEFLRNKPRSAKLYALESLKISQEIGFPRNIIKASKLLSEIYEVENNSSEALKMLRLNIQFKDSMDIIEYNKAIIERQAKYEYDITRKKDVLEHDLELAIKDEKIKNEKSFNYLLVALLALVAIFMIVIIERLRKINNLKLSLAIKNSENEKLVVNLESVVENRTLNLKESLELIEVNEKNYRDLLDKSSEMIQMLDTQGAITYANQAWLNNMSFNSLDEVKGRSISDFLTEETGMKFQTIMPELMQGHSVDELSCEFLTSKSREIILKGRTRPILKDGEFFGSQAFFFNVTDVEKAKREMDQMASFKEIMLNITTEYINAPISEIDNVINTSLFEIAQFSSADRAYVFKYDFEKEICSITHEWVAEGVPSQIEELKAMPFSKVPLSLSLHKKGELVEFSDVADVEDERVRKVLSDEGTQSMISIPMMQDNEAIGFVGFDIMKKKREFTVDEKNLLRIYSQMMLNVFNRISYIEELQNTKEELAKINRSLEKKVMENTKKNMDLSRSILEQEKLVTIGEISAGIAHDLNTPLGTIRVGADNINFILNSIFNGTISVFSKEELAHIVNHVEKNKIEMYVGGLQMRKEKVKMLEYLNGSFHDESPEYLDEIGDLLVKCRFDITQEEEISLILSKPFAKEYLQIMNQLQMAMAQLETIRKSSDKAVRVVQDMRAFIKGESVVEQKKINLRDNISTVLGVFNYEISLNVNLIFDVDTSIEFMGYDIKLFQLWSNIVKNGLEAMSEQKEKYLGIFAEKTGTQLRVVFENNGPKIPKEIAESIFQKFYTTKGTKSGSGLGLSIVKNVLKEHNADIILESDEARTKFIITFEL